MKKIFMCFLCIGFASTMAQRSILYPGYFRAYDLYWDLDTTSFPQQLMVTGDYSEDFDTAYYTMIQRTIKETRPNADTGWSGNTESSLYIDNGFVKYYNQLDHFRVGFFNGMSHYYTFSNDLNYIFTFNPNVAHALYLDSIKQADAINDLVICKDSLLYCSVSNNHINYIVRKKGSRGGWETLPVVVPNKSALDNVARIVFAVIVVLSLFGGILFFVRWKKAQEIKGFLKKARPDANDLKLAADKPLEYDQIKNKDTKAAIDAMVDVIKNRNTPLPMTIAINGAWGSGKSTIMNCIREKLDGDDQERFITTWFNAWHQQTESSLLDAFLLKVINRYEKPFYKKNGLKARLAFVRFRAQLAVSRFIKWPFYTQALSGFALGFLIVSVLIIIINLYGWVDSPVLENAGPLNINLTYFFKDNHFTSIIAIVIPILSFFFLKSESNPTIGAFLNVMYKKTFLVEVEKNTPDLREKFRAQYWEIMEAVGDRVLVVFIDDMDRVNGDKIFEMLEAINFIGDITSRPDDQESNSLKTVFVLGLYIDQVAEHLGIFLQKENAYKNEEPFSREEAKTLGKRYIEKMVQLNVPVPLTKDDV
ncbi:KAP family P-loop NTPase fold protein [Pinibacter soli]|uniref:P-loop NTPase fold protein n=1 Tax=Pinibacter soli TaxID=3044211 RepID=A0ABT6RCC4_9BACT|nr:P-loop NTPase fold protein [Pinibacter soli]MDI3320185.1 P-loop NTPase fold protein [Pinibacter soli]